MNELEIKKEVIKISTLMEERGLANGIEGNFSIIDRESGRLYITPSATRKSFLTPEMIAVMEGDDQVDGSCKRSSEYLLHQAVLKARPDCNAVAHAHPPFLTAFAFCGESFSLRCCTTFALVCGDKIPLVPYKKPESAELTEGIAEALEISDIILLENHGIVCAGKTLDRACGIVESMENAARTYAYTKMMGMKTKDIPADEYKRLIEE